MEAIGLIPTSAPMPAWRVAAKYRKNLATRLASKKLGHGPWEPHHQPRLANRWTFEFKQIRHGIMLEDYPINTGKVVGRFD